MTLWILTNLMLTLTLSMLLTPSPFAMGLTILSIAILVATFFSLSMSSWFAFLIFLIYVGGMLVMFSYFLALTPNQPSIFSSHLLTLTLTLIALLLTTKLAQLMPFSLPFFSNQLETLFRGPNSLILVSLAIILLIAMIVVVKVSCRSKGPLRAFMSYVQTFTNHTPRY